MIKYKPDFYKRYTIHFPFNGLFSIPLLKSFYSKACNRDLKGMYWEFYIIWTILETFQQINNARIFKQNTPLSHYYICAESQRPRVVGNIQIEILLLLKLKVGWTLQLLLHLIPSFRQPVVYISYPICLANIVEPMIDQKVPRTLSNFQMNNSWKGSIGLRLLVKLN